MNSLDKLREIAEAAEGHDVLDMFRFHGTFNPALVKLMVEALTASEILVEDVECSSIEAVRNKLQAIREHLEGKG